MILHGNTGSPSCAANGPTPEALLYTSGTPGFGLVPDGVHAVTVTYQTAAARTLDVHDNFFVIRDINQAAPPCGVQWLSPTGNVIKIAAGCSYLQLLAAPLQAYRGYVESTFTTLQSQVQALVAAVASGDIAGAEAAWLTAHLTWLKLGQDDGAYGAFGELGREIDGTAAGLVGGTASPNFTGFHKIELDLWTNQSLSAAMTDADHLEALVTDLFKVPLGSELPYTGIGVANWILRPHEVLEDALRDSLTADDDYGSGTDLASITADVAAVRELLTLLVGVLNPIAPGLVGHARAEITSLSNTIVSTQTAGGGWVAIQDLPVRARQQVDADVDAALETLAPIPELLTSTGKGAPAS